jgi:DNA-directed RNA polymerase subunit M/transcription elongation factor TFIIS
MDHCIKCGVVLTPENRMKNKKKYKCKLCQSKYDKDYREKSFSNKSKRVRMWAIDTLNGHRRNGFIINITIDELTNYAMLVDKCEYTGIELNWFSRGCQSYNSPSLDRLNGEREIRIDNIRIISYKMNAMKQDLTFKEYINHCKFMVSKYGDN